VSIGTAKERRAYLDRIQDEHREIVAGIRAHAVSKARAAMRRHLANSRARYQKLAQTLEHQI
jgi:DNA-binding FadR family transcriptional regulator